MCVKWEVIFFNLCKESRSATSVSFCLLSMITDPIPAHIRHCLVDSLLSETFPIGVIMGDRK